MMQICLVFAGMLIVASAQSVTCKWRNSSSARNNIVTKYCITTNTATGTCASIGYSTSCCPPSEGDACLATDGDCSCSTDCHIFRDCCEDAHCPSRNVSQEAVLQISLCIKCCVQLQSQEPVEILVSHNAVTIQVAVDFAMSTTNAQITDVRAMSPAMRGMTAVQMH